MGKKQEVIEEIYLHCKKRNNYIFDNQLVKKISLRIGFKNPFDATKIDNTNKLPNLLREDDYFIVHLGEGRHKFIKGINFGYHNFEKISENDIHEWKYRKSLLNEYDTSESNILSVASNQRIIHDFLYEDIIASPKVYNARRTKASISYKIGNTKIETKNLQMEIDFTLEYMGEVTIIEGKNGFPDNFAIYQLFHPYKYYEDLKRKENLKINSIKSCYILRETVDGNSILQLYIYTFEDKNDMSSIKLEKCAQYNMVKR